MGMRQRQASYVHIYVFFMQIESQGGEELGVLHQKKPGKRLKMTKIIITNTFAYRALKSKVKIIIMNSFKADFLALSSDFTLTLLAV